MGGIRNIIILLIITAVQPDLTAQNLYNYRPHPVSTRVFDETAPVLTREGMVYSTNQPYSTIANQEDEFGNFLDLYISVEDENGKWSKGKVYSEKLRFPQHDGIATFNFNEDLIFFTRNKEMPAPLGFRALLTGKRKVKNPELGLFFATRSDQEWGEVQEFPHDESDNIHPCLSPMADLLYFASNRPGGFGGYDLYVSTYMNGIWTEPENLGPVVNSASNELYPYLHSSGRLYFSSDGHDNNIGGYDIFYTDFFNSRWFSPVKLSAPFNSGLNDFTYYADDNFETGFFTTNRRGSLDIYTFKINLPNFDVCKQQVEDNFCYIFYEENTVSLDSNLYLYEWDLGNGTRIRAVEAEHCYAGPGDYLVKLNVVDKLTGIVAFNQAEYLVEVRKVIQPFITCQDTVSVNEEFQLHGLDSYLGEETPGEYYWDYGDGQKDIGATVRHAFNSPGSYKIKLGIIADSDDPETAQRFCTYKTIIITE